MISSSVGLNLNPGKSFTEASLAVGLEKTMDVNSWVNGGLYSRYGELYLRLFVDGDKSVGKGHL